MTPEHAIFQLSREHICNEVARQAAIEALEKQIPKKPKIEKARYANIIEFICPTCSKLITIKDGDYLERKSFL